MPDNSQAGIRAAALKRWPALTSSTISGSGPYAFLSRCGAYPITRLFESWNAMMIAVQKDCGAARCQVHTHSWVKLTPEKPAAPVWRPKPHWYHQLNDSR
jgi:hypothetical protein